MDRMRRTYRSAIDRIFQLRPARKQTLYHAIRREDSMRTKR